MSLRSSGLIAEDVDGALTHGDDGTLDVLALTDPVAGAVGLALAVLGGDGTDLDAEDTLEGNLDLGLVRAGVNLEGVLAQVHEGERLLGGDRLQDDVAGVLTRFNRAHLVSSLVPRKDSRAACVKTMSSASRTSYVFSWSAHRT